MGVDNWSVLTRLKRAVKKVRFLLHFNVNRWRLASMINRTSSSNHHRISFNDRPGLRACTHDDNFDTESEESGASARSLQRTISYPSEDDIDKRADMFIANFYRQLKLDRQISLELHYCRGNSFEAISP